jgi:hypothetical protein
VLLIGRRFAGASASDRRTIHGDAAGPLHTAGDHAIADDDLSAAAGFVNQNRSDQSTNRSILRRIMTPIDHSASQHYRE